jgi:hypothetical protein
MKGASIFPTQNAALVTDLVLLKKLTVFLSASGLCIKAGIASQYLTGLPNQFISSISGQSFQRVIYGKNHAVRIHHHEPVQHGLDDGFPIPVVLFFQHKWLLESFQRT